MAFRHRLVLALVIALALAPQWSFAKSYLVQVGTPKRPGTVKLYLGVGSVVLELSISIVPPLTAGDKRDQIVTALWGGTRLNVELVGDSQFRIANLPPNMFVVFDPGETGETDIWWQDESPPPPLPWDSGPAFSGGFVAFSEPGVPAIFTAGIVTDVGELTASVSAQELNFQTQGPIICQALFQRLAPQAPAFGAQLQLAGDRILVNFNPAFATMRSGVVFGTTSPTPGCQGRLGPSPAPPCPGDADYDGDVDQDDMDLVLFNFDNAVIPGIAGDTNASGYVDQDDLDEVLFYFGASCP